MVDWGWGIIGIGCFLLFTFIGMRVAFAGMLTGLLLFLIIYGDWNVAGTTLTSLIFNNNSSYSMTVIPLFVFMGYVAYYAGTGSEIYEAARAWVGWLPGGLAIATVFACAFFGAISGSSLAAVAMFAKISLPELNRSKYDSNLSIGCVASAGTLASLIPPSILVVIYGIIAQQSIGKLLIAGFIPGAISAIIYFLLILMRCLVNPKLGPPGPVTSIREKVVSLKGIIAVLIVMVIILGGIYSGVFTPTEAGACSAFVMMINVFLKERRFDWKKLMMALRDTVSLSAVIFFIIVGIDLMAKAATSSGALGALVDIAISLPVSPYVLLFLVFILYVILGAFIVAPGMMVLTVPFVVPVLVSAGFDPIWLGIIVIKFCEIGMITPPIGINVFVVAPIAKKSVVDCFRGVLPFLVADILTVCLFVIFPGLVTFIPYLMD